MQNKWFQAIDRSKTPEPTEPPINPTELVMSITSKKGDERAAALTEAVSILEGSPKQRTLVRFGYGFHTLSASEREQLTGRSEAEISAARAARKAARATTPAQVRIGQASRVHARFQAPGLRTEKPTDTTITTPDAAPPAVEVPPKG
jgi:hypothetical protein